jgi:hypothetical protein
MEEDMMEVAFFTPVSVLHASAGKFTPMLVVRIAGFLARDELRLVLLG